MKIQTFWVVRGAILSRKEISWRLGAIQFGNDIEENFGASVSCLTARKADYLIGFRSAEEIRSRCAKTKEKIHRRRIAKSGK